MGKREEMRGGVGYSGMKTVRDQTSKMQLESNSLLQGLFYHLSTISIVLKLLVNLFVLDKMKYVFYLPLCFQPLVTYHEHSINVGRMNN